MDAGGDERSGAGDGSGSSSGPPVQMTYLVKQLELAIRKHMDRSIRRYGLTTPQYTALSVLARHPGMSSAQLARRSFVTPQAANEMVTALERKGLLERFADVNNQRVLEMYLTASGGRTLELCGAGVLELERRMLAPIGPDAGAELRRLLGACVSALRDPPTGPRPPGSL